MAQYPIVQRFGGSNSRLNITTKTLVKATPGTLWAISVITAPTVAGAAYDAASTSTSAAQQVADIPTANPAQPIALSWPCLAGIVIDPGTGGVVSVAFA